MIMKAMQILFSLFFSSSVKRKKNLGFFHFTFIHIGVVLEIRDEKNILGILMNYDLTDKLEVFAAVCITTADSKHVLDDI